MAKTKSIALILGVLIMSLLVGYLVLAWTEPPYGGVCTTPPCPPGGNVPAPLNIGPDTQAKAGRLDFQAFYDYDDPSRAWYIDPYNSTVAGLFRGNVGIGTTTPGYRLDVQGGNFNVSGNLFTGGTQRISSAGVVTNATWQGTAIGTQYGGTGQNWLAVSQGSIPFFSATGTMSTLGPGTSGQFLKTQGAGANLIWAAIPAGGGAPIDATYITQTSNATLTAEQALSGLATGLLKNTTGTGVLTIATPGTDYTNIGNTIESGEITDLTIATIDIAGLAVTNAKISEMDWTKLQTYPAACPANQFVTTIGDTLTCAAPPTSGIGGSGTATQVAFFTAATTIGSDSGLYWDNTNKRLGIGTTSPTTPLYVVGTATFGGGKASIDSTGRTLSLGNNTETVSADSAAGGYTYLVRESTGIIQLSAQGGGAINKINLVGNTIYASGNVGIGTTDPNRKLQVVGQIAATDGGGATPGEWIMLWPQDSAIIARSDNPIRIGHAADLGAGSWVERMRIDTAGNVGIGTTSPGYKLDVAGTLRTTDDLYVDTGSGAGYMQLLVPSGDTYNPFASFSKTWQHEHIQGEGMSYTPLLELDGGLWVMGDGTADSGSLKVQHTAEVGGNLNVSGNLNVGGKIYGWNVPSDVKTTTATHDGNFGGYQAMYNWIQANGCSGYHVCDATELTRWAQIGGAKPTGSCWYNSGIYSQDATGGYFYSDCTGWTGSQNGPVWYVGGTANRPLSYSCSMSYTVCCCK